MALTPDAGPSTNKRLEQTLESYERDLIAIVENVRWLTTLVLAEMAGIAVYRTRSSNLELGLGYAALIVILGLALAAFVVAVIRSRYERGTFAKRFHCAVVGIAARSSELLADNDIAPAAGTVKLVEMRENAIKHLPSSFDVSAVLEFSGLALLALASVLAAFMVFFSEVAASLFGAR
ncbi:MAG: hypothetical protein E6K79_01915 [Candidatus Eisenbacteria bacterium]|uniref:Uncharacterized protein n=1 Tax=Eiseniibacteriota bacterium TaxID=2212470 RepID=A0A538TSS6_UNCEI|nr:MAG: hypothetical protein E6K79_01915 [Candidatus Eisenbacteria bacterium]